MSATEQALSDERERQIGIVMEANPALSREEAIQGVISIEEKQGIDSSDLTADSPDADPSPDEPSADPPPEPTPAPAVVIEDGPVEESPAFTMADERVKLESEDEDAPPPRRPPKGKGKQRTTKVVRNVFKKVLPAGDLLRVYYTGPTGRKSFIDKYRQRDIQKSGDIESFIKEYLYPEYGPGEYFLEQQDAKGDIVPRGSITIKGKTQKDGNVMATKDIIEMTQRATEAGKKEATEQATAINSMMNGFMNIVASMQKSNGQDGGASQMLSMIMPMMMQMMQMMAQPREDPMQGVILSMLLKERDSAPGVPFPPLAASPPPTDSLEMIRTFAEIMKMNQPQMSTADIIGLLTKKEGGIGETMQVVTALKDFIKPATEGAKSFGETLENVNAVRGLLEEMNPGKDTYTIASIAEAISNMATSYRDTTVAKAMTQGQPGQQQVVNQQGQPVQGQGQPAQGQGQPTQGQGQPAQQLSDKEKYRRSTPPIPLGFRRYSLLMKKAVREQNEDDLVSHFLEGLNFLHEKGERRWVEFVEKFQAFVKEDEREKAMALVKGFLQTFEANDLIDAGIAETIYETMDIYWGDVGVALGFREAEPDGEGGEPDEEVPDPNAGATEIANAQPSQPTEGDSQPQEPAKAPEPPAEGGRVDPENPTTGDVLTAYEEEEAEPGEEDG